MSTFKVNSRDKKRGQRTLYFISKNYTTKQPILDLGIENYVSQEMKKLGFLVKNTPMGMDLDLDYEIVKNEKYGLVTAFEIFEHMVSPFPLLKAIKADKLIASVPLNLWFSKTYWNYNDPFDRHYHEFEPRQFDMLLEKAGWKIVKSEKWMGDIGYLGIRPILRKFYPRFYIVYCERI